MGRRIYGGSSMFFVLNKKRVLFVCFCILISTCSFLGMQNLELNRDSQDVVQVVALPIDKKTIILDAGHGKPDRRSNSR